MRETIIKIFAAAGVLIPLAGFIFAFMKQISDWNGKLQKLEQEKITEVIKMEDKMLDLKPFLDEEGRLTSLPAKHRKKLIALWYLAGKLETERQYTEPEINELLDKWTTFHDHATLRRELYNKHLLNRTLDCKRYWKETKIPELNDFLISNL